MPLLSPAITISFPSFLFSSKVTSFIPIFLFSIVLNIFSSPGFVPYALPPCLSILTLSEVSSGFIFQLSSAPFMTTSEVLSTYLTDVSFITSSLILLDSLILIAVSFKEENHPEPLLKAGGTSIYNF